MNSLSRTILSLVVFVSLGKIRCKLGVDFVTLWKWETNPRYPHPGVEDRIGNISSEILQEMKRRCGQIKTF